MAWENCNNPAEQEGKGVAIKSTTQFFTWLKEADEEEPATTSSSGVSSSSSSAAASAAPAAAAAT